MQQYCQKMNREGKEMKEMLENAELKCQEAEKNNQRLQSEIGIYVGKLGWITKPFTFCAFS